MSLLQIKKLFRRRGSGLKAIIALILITTPSLLFFLHWTSLHNYFTLQPDFIREDSFLQVSKCPACYGVEICSHFMSDVTSFNINATSGHVWSRITSYVTRNWFNAKNVYYATFKRQKVVLKKLAQNWEFDLLDKTILKLRTERNLNSYKSYDVGTALTSLVTEAQIHSLAADEYTSLYRLLRDVQTKMETDGFVSDAIHCENRRFFQLAIQKYKHNYDYHRNDMYAISNLLTTLLINTEPVIMRVFSESSLKHRFPKYLGSCGRVIVENYVGVTLDHYRTAPWPRRLRLALDLLRFTEQMTENSLNMNLYWTDVSFHNYVVTSDDHIILVDVEGIVIVDSNSTDRLHGSIHSNPFGNHDLNEGLQFSLDDLCSHNTADHNIYAVCKCMLSSNPCSYGIPGGLLWGTSEAIERRWNLQTLVRQCVISSNRFVVFKKLVMTMESIIVELNESS